MTEPRSSLAVFVGQRTAAEEVKVAGWRKQRILVVALDDRRLTAAERHAVELLGDRLYGKDGR